MRRFLCTLLLPLVMVSGCRFLPPVGQKTATVARAKPTGGPLVQAAGAVARRGASGQDSFLLLEEAKEALEWRLALIDSARSSLDCQALLWGLDASGLLLLDHLFQAADRGVRVRVMVDDVMQTGRDLDFATVALHPNVEVRMFNPVPIRGSDQHKLAGILTDFPSFNRRMHNKTFTVDNVMTIVGGRNNADQYFGLNRVYNFRDLDVLAVGPVVQDVSRGFDHYWNSGNSYPAGSLSRVERPSDLVALRQTIRTSVAGKQGGVLRSFPASPVSWERKLAGLERRMVGGKARFVYDHPERAHDRRRVVAGLRKMLGQLESELLVATPYFLPPEWLLKDLELLRRNGAAVRLVAPTLRANNWAPVHAHYRKQRRRVLRAGVELFEYRHDPGERARRVSDTAPVRSGEINLHTKALVGDRRYCYLGSLNLDPRAMVINTELGLFIDSPKLAGRLAMLIADEMSPESSWQVTLDSRDRLTWTSRGRSVRREPAIGLIEQIRLGFFGILPVRSQF